MATITTTTTTTLLLLEARRRISRAPPHRPEVVVEALERVLAQLPEADVDAAAYEAFAAFLLRRVAADWLGCFSEAERRDRFDAFFLAVPEAAGVLPAAFVALVDAVAASPPGDDGDGGGGTLGAATRLLERFAARGDLLQAVLRGAAAGRGGGGRVAVAVCAAPDLVASRLRGGGGLSPAAYFRAVAAWALAVALEEAGGVHAATARK